MFDFRLSDPSMTKNLHKLIKESKIDAKCSQSIATIKTAKTTIRVGGACISFWGWNIAMILYKDYQIIEIFQPLKPIFEWNLDASVVPKNAYQSFFSVPSRDYTFSNVIVIH